MSNSSVAHEISPSIYTHSAETGGTYGKPQADGLRACDDKLFEARQLGKRLETETNKLNLLLMTGVEKHREAGFWAEQNMIVLCTEDMLRVLDICEMILNLLDKYEIELVKNNLHGLITTSQLTTLRSQINILKRFFTLGSLTRNCIEEIEHGITLGHNLRQYVPTPVRFFTTDPVRMTKLVTSPDVAEITH